MKNSIGVILLLLLISFGCKSKTELYLERGLDILSNKEVIDFDLYSGITIKELGVIRDQKESVKTLVLKLDNSTDEKAFKNEYEIGIRVWILDKNKTKRIENWDFKPKLTQVKGYKYILRKIRIEEDKIKKMKIYMFSKKNGKKIKIGDSLIINKVNTYND